MWDLIVSVPDHCLSFYFRHCPFFHYSSMQISLFINVHLNLLLVTSRKLSKFKLVYISIFNYYSGQLSLSFS